MRNVAILALLLAGALLAGIGLAPSAAWAHGHGHGGGHSGSPIGSFVVVGPGAFGGPRPAFGSPGGFFHPAGSGWGWGWPGGVAAGPADAAEESAREADVDARIHDAEHGTSSNPAPPAPSQPRAGSDDTTGWQPL